MDKPTVGRIVHFYQRDMHYASIITEVHSEHEVSLYVFPRFLVEDGPTPWALNERNCAYKVPIDLAASRDWTWHWPERA